MLDTQISKYQTIGLIYETYHIIPPGEKDIPVCLFTVEGIEGLVSDNKISREIATLIYKIMTTREEND